MLTEKGKTVVKWGIAALIGCAIAGPYGLALVGLIALLKCAV